MKWTHDNLAHDLAAHLATNSDRIIWTDMQLGPSGSPRPDVYTINKSYSRFCPIAYECKVSVADFRSDIAKGKWQSYLKYASGVIFAAPKGLVTKDDLPKGCGLIVRSENCWRMVKGPTMVPVNDLPRDFWMKLVIDGTARSLREHGITRMNQQQVHGAVAKKYGQELSEILAKRDRAGMQLQEQINFVKTQIADVDIVYAMQHAKRERDQLNNLKVEFCQLLNVPEDTSIWTVIHRVQDLLNALDKDEHIKQLRSAITSASRSLDSQVKQLRETLALVSSIEAPCKPLTKAGESN